jgi:hypothetical protein
MQGRLRHEDDELCRDGRDTRMMDYAGTAEKTRMMDYARSVRDGREDGGDGLCRDGREDGGDGLWRDGEETMIMDYAGTAKRRG